MAHYRIQALDKGGFDLTPGAEEHSVKTATVVARRYLADTELQSAGMHTVQVRDDNNQVVRDWFVKR